MANTLTLEQINEFRQAFNMFDINGKGVIGVKELKKVMTSLGQSLNKKALLAMVDELDTDGNRLIDFPEFLSLLAREFNKRRIEVDVKNAFSARELTEINDALEIINGTKNKKSLKSKDLIGFVSMFSNVQYSENEIINAVNEFEDKETRVIEYTQLLILLARKLDRMDSEEELREAFQVFDHDEDGLISLTDLRYFMNNIAGEKRMDDKQLMEMIREADFDGDGFLNEREFIAVMRPEAKFIKLNI